MPLQDLTPQLRTRLSRLERLVGLFISFATLLLLVGLGYYVYEMARHKGWFLTKMPYFTFVQSASGLSVGDRVKLMGFDAGEIIEILPERPENPWFNVYIRFRVNEPYYGYLWEDSRARIGASGVLGGRFIEVTKGSSGAPTYPSHLVRESSLPELRKWVAGTNKVNLKFGQNVKADTNVLVRAGDWVTRQSLDQIEQVGLSQILIIDYDQPLDRPTWIWDDKKSRYRPIVSEEDRKGYWLRVEESPALTERLEAVVNTVENALPGFLAITNRLASVLSNAQALVQHTDDLLVSAKPAVTNVALITANLTEPKGSLGEWAIPTNVNSGLQATLNTANSTVQTAQTNIAALSAGVLETLIHVSNITSNLNSQVQANSLILRQVSDLIIHTDEMMQGLKRHWLLRSAFAEGTNAPIESVVKPTVGGSR